MRTPDPGPFSRLRILKPAIAAIGLIAFALASCSSGGSDNSGAETGATEEGDEAQSLVLDPEEFISFIEAEPGAPVVNVHVPYEGHIEGTDAFVPFEEIGEWSDLPSDRSDPIVLYCQSGRMSAIAADTLAQMGYTSVVDLEGGMNAWADAGEQLIHGAPNSEATD